MTGDDGYFQTRLAYDDRREVLWRTLCRYHFAKFVSSSDCVLELGAGYGAFINNISARRRIAVDTWPGFLPHLVPGVEGEVRDVTDLAFLSDRSVNFVFASNLFEHVSHDAFGSVLGQLRRVLAPDGTLNIVQPNFYYAYREYFDDYTHQSVYSHISLCDFVVANGYAIIECRKKFLPLTLKSRFPVFPALIRAYLASPWKPMAKQMLVRAKVRTA